MTENSLAKNFGLFLRLLRHELTLTEQGTVFGFFLAFVNNVIMLWVFHSLFVPNFLKDLPNPWLYLLLGIVQWNLYVNVSLVGFGCFIYRKHIVMGYCFSRKVLVFARTATVFVPYIAELAVILAIAVYMDLFPKWQIIFLPFFIFLQYLFCTGICFMFAYIGCRHKNVIPFWNIMFRLLSFATPIFYVPFQFENKYYNILYSWNPFTQFMIHLRDYFNANHFIPGFSIYRVMLLAVVFFTAGIGFYELRKHRIGDSL